MPFTITAMVNYGNESKAEKKLESGKVIRTPYMRHLLCHSAIYTGANAEESLTGNGHRDNLPYEPYPSVLPQSILHSPF